LEEKQHERSVIIKNEQRRPTTTTNDKKQTTKGEPLKKAFKRQTSVLKCKRNAKTAKAT
jgi:hypothetical protein